MKKKISAEGKRRISEAQVARWVKIRKEKADENLSGAVRSVKVSSRQQNFSFLNERMKIYDSPMEAYVDGYLEGYEDAKYSRS